MSKHITKFDCEQAAKKLAAIAFDNKIKKAEEEEKAIGDELVKKYVPAPILAIGKEYAEMFVNSGRIISVKEDSDTYNCFMVDTNTLNPLGYSKTFLIDKADAKYVTNVVKNHKSLNNQKRTYINNVTEALWQLRSKKRIEEQFPEALPYLDFDDDKQLPMPQYIELRNMLK